MNNYGNIDNDSALVTSQYHMNDSPKAIIEYSHSERLETATKLNKPQDEQTELQNLQLNSHMLPQITIVCHSPQVLASIVQEMQLYQYQQVLWERKQILLMHVTKASIAQQLCPCRDSYIPSQSNNSIIQVIFKQQKLIINALSGNYKLNQDTVLTIANCVRRFNIQNRGNIMVIDDDIHNPYNLITNCSHQVHMHLSQDNSFQIKLTRLRSQIQQLLKPTKSQLQQQHNEAQQLVLDTLQLFKPNTKKHMHPYYALQIEKIVFEDIFDYLFPFYETLYQNQEQKLILNKAQIKQKVTDVEAIKFLEIKLKYQKSEFTPGIKELNNINLVNNPREKLRHIQLMQCLVKSAVYEESGEELLTMDDELPVIIYIALLSDIQLHYANFAYVDDFCNTDPTIETERRLLTTLQGSLSFISKEWKV